MVSQSEEIGMTHILAAIMGALTGYGLASLAAYLRPPERGTPDRAIQISNVTRLTPEERRDFDALAWRDRLVPEGV